mmetsp:Transcript_44268/g.114463  ORF Transcript_44268/g.114463 Transcript_44268/m.114463 type:complete len:207 (+) Transcript_44268:432-1052(+)
MACCRMSSGKSANIEAAVISRLQRSKKATTAGSFERSCAGGGRAACRGVLATVNRWSRLLGITAPPILATATALRAKPCKRPATLPSFVPLGSKSFIQITCASSGSPLIISIVSASRPRYLDHVCRTNPSKRPHTLPSFVPLPSKVMTTASRTWSGIAIMNSTTFWSRPHIAANCCTVAAASAPPPPRETCGMATVVTTPRTEVTG